MRAEGDRHSPTKPGPMKPGRVKKGPPPDVLRKSGAHRDKKRQTGREPIRKEELDEKE